MAEPAHIPGADDLRRLLAEIAEAHMPFGMYGPSRFPPQGCPVMDLPAEYLDWFRLRGFPRSRLGFLMQQTLQIKDAGLDALFEPFRAAAGGRRHFPRKK